MKIIALTGGIGCGKTTVAAIFRESGFIRIDADALCHQLYADPQSGLTEKIRAEWGDAVIASDGTADRKALAEKVFDAPEEIQKLTGIIYPLLEKEVKRQIKDARESGADFVLLDIPLLYESGWDRLADTVIAVWTPDHIRNRRLMDGRGWDMPEIRRRRSLQMDDSKKLERADYGLINDGTPAQLKQQCELLIRELKNK